MILVVQTNKEKDTVEVLFDKQGLELLRTVIKKDWYEPINKENIFILHLFLILPIFLTTRPLSYSPLSEEIHQPAHWFSRNRQ